MNPSAGGPLLRPVCPIGADELAASGVSARSESPPVSVLVICYDRRQYVLNAVRSVVDRSDLSPGLEVLVLKNFADPQIDGELRRLGAVCPSVTGTNEGSW